MLLLLLHKRGFEDGGGVWGADTAVATRGRCTTKHGVGTFRFPPKRSNSSLQGVYTAYQALQSSNVHVHGYGRLTDGFKLPVWGGAACGRLMQVMAATRSGPQLPASNCDFPTVPNLP